MRLPTLGRRAPFALVALAGLLAAGCNNNATAPTPVLTTDTFTGTIPLLGADSKTFTVTYNLAVTDASITLTALVDATSSAPLTTPIGLAFGSIAFDGSCTASPTYTSNTAQINQELVASGVFSAGVYCVRVFDPGTLTAPAIYTVAVKHY